MSAPAYQHLAFRERCIPKEPPSGLWLAFGLYCKGMLDVLREMESFVTMGRNRATRSAEKFSRPFGTAFFLAAKAHGSGQIPINWAEEVVAFSIAPIKREKRAMLPRRRSTAA